MPYLNEHAARLLDPDLFDPDTFRRTHGSGEGRVQGVKIPDTIDVIWGKLKEKNKPSDPVVAQALRFPIEHWTFEETKNWLEKNGIKYIELVKAKGNKKNIEMEKEIRSFESDCAIEEREIDGVNKKIVTGYAAVFNKESRDLGGFTEILSPECFENCDLSDVAALFNHDPNLVLARKFNDSGTLSLQIDERGLKYTFELPKHHIGAMLEESIKRGDVLHSSFAFTIKSDKWEKIEERVIRIITSINKLYDISPVLSPAYYATTVTMRGLEEFKKSSEIPINTIYTRYRLEHVKHQI